MTVYAILGAVPECARDRSGERFLGIRLIPLCRQREEYIKTVGIKCMDFQLFYTNSNLFRS